MFTQRQARDGREREGNVMILKLFSAVLYLDQCDFHHSTIGAGSHLKGSDTAASTTTPELQS